MAKLETKDRVYRLRNGRPLSYKLATRHTHRKKLLYFDGKTNRPLRYARNQKSPFIDEQDGEAYTEHVFFLDGMLYVPKENPELQLFLHYTPDNGKVFVEVDKERDAESEVEQMDYEADAIIAARNLDVNQLERIARVLLRSNVSKMTTAELKRDIRVYARKDPKGFLAALDDPESDYMAKVAEFFEYNVIQCRNKNRDVYFNLPKNKKRLLVIPPGEDPKRIVASYLRSQDGIETLKMLERHLDNIDE